MSSPSLALRTLILSWIFWSTCQGEAGLYIFCIWENRLSWSRPFLNPSTINSSRPSINTSLVASWPMPIGIQVFSGRLAFKSDNSVKKRTPAFSNKRWSSLAGSEGSRWIQVVHTRPPHVSFMNIAMEGFHCLSLKKTSWTNQKNRKLLAIGSQIKHLSWNQSWPSDTLASGWWNSSTVGPRIQQMDMGIEPWRNTLFRSSQPWLAFLGLAQLSPTQIDPTS